jgi:hypothetical protein
MLSERCNVFQLLHRLFLDRHTLRPAEDRHSFLAKKLFE